jgi:hypothetical protein
MKTLEEIDGKKDNGSPRVFWLGALAGVVALALVGYWIYNLPSAKQVDEQLLAGAMREGSSDFETFTKKIVVENDRERTMESPTALGTIQMSIWGKVRNLTGKRITGLEIKATVIDMLDKPVKEKTFVAVPKQRASIENFEVMEVNTMMDGFKKEDDRANIRWKVTAIKVE